MKSGVYDDIINAPSSGAYDDIIAKPDPAKRIAQGKTKSQVKRESVLQTSNIGALIGAGFGAKPISPNQRKANELAKITGKTVAPATTVTGVKNPKPKAASGMDLANMANELQERMSKALKPIDPPDWVPNPLLGALGFVPGVKEVAKPSNVISGVALGGVDVAGDVAAFADRNSTRDQQLGALANIVIKTPLATAGAGLALKGASKGLQLAFDAARNAKNAKALTQVLKQAEKQGVDIETLARGFKTEPAPVKLPKTQPTPSGVSQKAKREVKPVVKPVEEATYRSAHQIDASTARKVSDLKDINDDIELVKGKYGLTNYDRKDIARLNKILGKPDEDVVIYRASPVNELNDGDWVTNDLTYAKDIQRQNGGKIHKYVVKSDELSLPAKIEDNPSSSRFSAFQYNKRTPPTPPKATPESSKGAKEAWEMTREEYVTANPGKDYDKAVWDWEKQGRLSWEQASELSELDSLGNKQFWAKTRKELDAEFRDELRRLRGERADINKAPTSEMYAAWRKRANSTKAKQDIDYAQSRFEQSMGNNRPGSPYEKGLHHDRVEDALKEGKLTPERARELGHFDDYPDLAKKYGGKAEVKESPKPLESIGGPGKLPEGPKKLTGEIPKPTVKENLTVPKAEVPKVEEPKVAIPKDPTPASGLARRFRDPEQVAAGKEVTPAVPKNAKGLAEKGRKLYEQGKNPDEILERVAKNGERPSYDVDVPVIEHYKQIVRSEKATLIKARAKAKPQELPEIDTAIALLDGKSDEIEAFAQKAATEFHGMGEALQIAHNTESMAFVDIREQARALNLGEKLHPKMEKQLESLSKKYEDAMGQIEELKNQIQLKAVAFRGSSARRRSSALERIRGLGIETVDAPAPASPMKSKQSGAIKLPEFGTPREQLRRAVTELSSVYIKEGAKDIDEVLRRLSEDVPGLGRDDFLSLLSPAVRKYRTEAMVAAGQTRKVMSKVRAAAEFRTKSIAGKGFTIAADLGKNVKRNIQASYDLSAALLQGKPALLARPGSWLKSWDAAAKVLAPTAKDASGKVKWQGADEAAQRAYANIIQEPAIKEAVDQGWLKLRSPHGTFSPQEEIFRGEIAHIIPGVARSDAVFGSQLNAIYGDWYRKLAGLMPDNAEYKQSIGAIMNMLSGRGHGDFADVALSHPGVGWLGYAPKYAYSLAQVGTGAPVWFKGLHPKARIEAAKIYASGLATVYMVNKAAPLFGFEVDNDPRSVNFGTLEKDGKQYDAYNQLTQFPRMLLQMFYGKIGERGQYKNPGDWGFEPMMDYVHNKFSPFLRDIEIMSTGKMWDAGEGKMKTVTKEDLAWTFAPLAIQDIRRLEDKSGTSVALGVMGGRPKEAKAKDLKSGEKRAPDFDPMPPGLKRMLDGTE